MNPNPKPNPTTQAQRSYFWQLGLSLLVYFSMLFVISRYASIQAMANPWRILVVLLPIIPIIFAFAGFIRYVRATDELKRLIVVYSFAIAGGFNIFFNIICGLLAIAGIPYPSAFFAFCVFIGAQMIAGVCLHRHYYPRC